LDSGRGEPFRHPALHHDVNQIAEGSVKLVVLEDELAVARLDASDPIPEWGHRGSLSSIARTPEELSIVCAAAAVPAGIKAERGWRSLRVAGRLDFSLTGVLASIAGPLAAADVSIFAVSTYDTDYVLVREQCLPAAIACLRKAGHEVTGA
jgi:uncharacterized protein